MALGLVLALRLLPFLNAAPGTYDPKVLTPTADVVTPHVKWLKPSAAGPLRVLFVISQECMREIVELAQRMELDCRVVAVPARGTLNLPPLTDDDLRRDLLDKLSLDNELIVVAVRSWDRLTLWRRYQILKAVKAGTPLLSLEHAADEYLRRASRNKVTTTASFLCPYGGLPAFGRDDGELASPQETLQTSQFDRARVVLLRGIRGEPPQILTPARPETGLILNLAEYDYYMGWLAHVLLYAAGRDVPARVTTLSPSTLPCDGGTSLSFGVTAAAPQALTARFALRRRDGDVLRRDERTVSLGAGVNQLAFHVGRVPEGEYFADLWLADGGKVVDFGSGFVRAQGWARIEAVDLRPSYLAAEPVTGTVRLTLSRPAAGLTLHVSRVDNHGRLTGQAVLPFDGGAAGVSQFPFSLDPEPPLTIVQHLGVELRQGSETLSRRKTAYSVSDLPPEDDIRYVIWGIGGCSAKSYLAHHAYRVLADAGFDTQYTHFTAAVALANLRHIPYATRIQPAGEKGGDADPHVREPCLTDPAYWEKETAKLTRVAERVKPFSTCEFSMGDECHLRWGTMREVCFSPTCTAAFQRFLGTGYETIAKLNTRLGTAYDSFADVRPVTLEQAKEEPALVPLWIDHRRQMESVWAGMQAVCRDALRKVVPGARTGYEGTDYDNINSFDGFEFDKVMRVMTLNNTYDGVFAPYAVVDLARPGALLGTGWLGSYDEYKRHRHWPSRAYNRYICWRHLFRGANSFWVWYACLYDRGVGHGSVTAPDFSFFDCFAPNPREVAEIKAGVGKLLMQAERESDATAILYSPSSIHTATVCGTNGVQQDILRSLIPLMEDTGRQFRIVSCRQVAEGVLETGAFRFLLLPYVQALSSREAEMIKQFVAGGGTVVADVRPGVCDEHGGPHGKGILDDVFGITQDTTYRALEQGQVSSEIPLLPKDIPPLRHDTTLKAVGGRVLGRAGEAPALVVNTFGHGRGVLWNVAFDGYQRNAGVLSIEVETLGEDAVSLRAAFDALLSEAGLRRKLNLSPEIPSLRTYRYRCRDLRYVGLLQHPCRARAQWEAAGRDLITDEDGLAAPGHVPVRLELDASYHVYDVRTPKYLGRVGTVDVNLGPGRAKLFSLLPYAVRRIKLTAPPTVRAGEALPFTAELDVDGGTPGLHVFRTSLRTPAGDEPRWYTRNLKAAVGKTRSSVPLALNDQPGRWTLQVTDVATGVEAERHVTVVQ